MPISKQLLVTRPEIEAEAIANSLVDIGHVPIIVPLLHVRYRICEIDLRNLQAVVITSKAALRWLDSFDKKKQLLSLPVFVVGAASAKFARSIGFMNVFQGLGTAKELVPIIKMHSHCDKGVILHISGHDIAYNILPDLNELGFKTERVVVYETLALDKLPQNVCDLITRQELDGVLLLSPKTSKIWVNLVSKVPDIVDLSYMTAYCLSTAVAEPLKNFKNISKKIAKKPNIEELLALIP